MRLLSGFAWMVSGRLGAALLQALSLILVARSTTPADFGILAAFMGVIIVAQTIMDFGLPTYIIRSRAENPRSNLAAMALRVYGKVGILLLVALCVVAVSINVAYAKNWWGLLPLAFAGWLERQSDVRLSLAIADGDVWKNSLNLIIRRTATIVLLTAGINRHLNPIVVFGVASVLAALFSIILSRRLVDIRFGPQSVTWEETKRLVRASRAYWANSVGAQIRNLDALAVSLVGNPIAAGHYGAVSRSIGPLRMVTASLSTVLLPMAARNEGNKRRALMFSVVGVLAVMSLIYVVLALYAESVVLLVFGPQYLPATLAFQFIVLSLVFASGVSVLTPLLQVKGFQSSVGKISIASSIIALMAICAGAIYAGVSGASAGLAISYVLHLLVLLGVLLFSKRLDVKVASA